MEAHTECNDHLRLFWEGLTRGYCRSVPLSQILLDLEADLPPGAVRDATHDLRDQVMQNVSLWQAMANHPEVFTRAHVCLVEGGQRIGMTERVLSFIVEATWRCPTCTSLSVPGSR